LSATDLGWKHHASERVEYWPEVKKVATSGSGEHAGRHAGRGRLFRAEPSHLMTWQEICRRYPDQWVALVEITWVGDDEVADGSLPITHAETSGPGSGWTRSASRSRRWITGSYTVNCQRPAPSAICYGNSAAGSPMGTSCKCACSRGATSGSCNARRRGDRKFAGAESRAAAVADRRRWSRGKWVLRKWRKSRFRSARGNRQVEGDLWRFLPAEPTAGQTEAQQKDRQRCGHPHADSTSGSSITNSAPASS